MTALDLRSVDIFKTVAATGSATHAATVLGTTQPTVTRAIAEFEASCGLKLFDRGRFGMRLTAEGQLLLDAVQRSYAGLKVIGDAVDFIRAGARGSLRFVTIPVIGEGILSDLLGDFIGAHPDMRLSMRFDAQVLGLVAQDHADFAAIAGPLSGEADCEVLTVAQGALGVVMSVRDPLAARATIDFTDLHGRDMVLLETPHVIRATTDTAMFRQGVRPRIAHEVTTQRAIAALAASGHCIGFIDSHLAVTLDPAKLKIVPLRPGMTWDINLVWRRDRAPNRAMIVFLDWLKARDIDRGEKAAG
jgi:DNA-binding transcriptional LysR family regulator